MNWCVVPRLALVALGLMVGLAGCGSDEGGPVAVSPPAPVTTGSVSGLVAVASTGAAASGVMVSIGSRSASTAVDGSFTLTDVPASNEAVLRLQRSDLIDGVVALPVVAGATRHVEARLTPIGAPSTVDALAAATVRSANDRAQITLPGAYVNAGGAAVTTGAVAVSLTTFDIDADAANMPGRAVVAGATEAAAVQPIALFGAASVYLKDAAGASVQLAPGRAAVLRIPVSTRAPNPPATAVLYAFDATRVRWVASGSGVLAGSGLARYYEATIPQAGVWAAGQDEAQIRVTGCVKDNVGARASGARVQMIDNDHASPSVFYSNADGTFAVGLRRGGTGTLEAHLGSRGSAAVLVGPSDVDLMLASCLVVGATGVAPQIVGQPASQTGLSGSSIALGVNAGGSPLLTYQWQRNGVTVTGATGATLLVPSVGATDDGARYVAVVTNAFGTVASNAAVLTVTPPPPPPLIGQGPIAQQVPAGAAAVFDVTAVSQGGTLSYQWSRDGAPIAGASAARYTTPPTTLADDGATFSVVVSSSNGAAVTSAAVRLTVVAPLPLALTLQPVGASVAVGQTLSFSTAANGGSAPISYQWKRNGVVIAGAVSATYATPALTLGDGGAAYAVTVSSGSETVTSASASVSVTQTVATSGYFFVDVAGPTVDGNQIFANGQKSNGGSTNLMAVDASGLVPSAVAIDTGSRPINILASVKEATLGNGRLRDFRSRAVTYFKAGRLYKVDQVVSGAGVPQPQLLSTLQTTDLCADDYGYPWTPGGEAGTSFDAPLRTWLFFQGPGADGQCGTSDDDWRAVRLDMSSGDAALTVGEPLNDIVDAYGRLVGIVMRQGGRLVRVDADLANPVPMFAIDPATLFNGGWQFGLSMPGRWLFIEAGKLWGVDLAAPSTRVELATLAPGETGSGALFRSDATGAYIAFNGTAASRVIRIADPWTVSTVASFDSPVRGINLTPTRAIVRTGGTTAQYLSMPKTGGAATTLLSLAGGRSAGTSTASGEVFYVSYREASSPTYATLVVGADGAGPEILPTTAVSVTMLSADISVASRWLFTSNQTYAIGLIDNAQAYGDVVGGSFWALEGATRRRLVTYGTVPSDGLSNVSLGWQAPRQYGGPGLLIFFSGTGDDLLYVKSDTPGLQRVTTLAPSSGAQPSATAGKRAAARVTRPTSSGLLSR